jgi:hypothetical protein
MHESVVSSVIFDNKDFRNYMFFSLLLLLLLLLLPLPPPLILAFGEQCNAILGTLSCILHSVWPYHLRVVFSGLLMTDEVAPIPFHSVPNLAAADHIT